MGMSRVSGSLRRGIFVGAVGVVSLLTLGCAPDVPPGPPSSSLATITIDGQLVKVQGPAGSTVTVTSSDATALPPMPAGLQFPVGALDLTIGNVTAGAVSDATVTLEQPVDSVRKLIGGAWDSFLSDGTTGATVSSDGLTITLQLQDGGRGDADATADGVIHDPLAPVDSAVSHVTTWESDVAYPDTEPDIVSWIGYGSFAFNEGFGGCRILPGGSGFNKAFTRVDPQTVHVAITLDWVEGDNGVDGYGCGVQPSLSVGLRDAGGTEVVFALLDLSSHA